MLITMAKLHIQLRKMTLFKKDLLYINPVVYKDYLYTYLIGTGIRVKIIHMWNFMKSYTCIWEQLRKKLIMIMDLQYS